MSTRNHDASTVTNAARVRAAFISESRNNMKSQKYNFSEQVLSIGEGQFTTFKTSGGYYNYDAGMIVQPVLPPVTPPS